MNYFNTAKSENNVVVKYDYMEKFMELFKVYLAFINFVDLVCPSTNRLIWTRDEFRQNERDLHSLYNQLLDLIKNRNNREFRKFTRINIATYEHLLRLLKKKLQKTSQRKPIPTECRLLITLMYLAFDSPRPLLSMAFRLGLSTLRNIICETCECIATELSSVYCLKTLNEDDYFELSEEYLESTGLPNCVGSLEAIEFLTERKTKDPIILFATSNMKYQLINVDVGLIHEIVQMDNFAKNIVDCNLTTLPVEMQLPDTGVMLQPYVVTPSGFPLVKHSMSPYPGKVLNSAKMNLNEHLKNCSHYVENAMGVLLYKWRVLQNKFTCLPATTVNIIKTCVILHNFAIEHDRSYFHDLLVDQEDRRGVWRQNVNLPKSKFYDHYLHNADDEGFINRDLLKDYLYSDTI